MAVLQGAGVKVLATSVFVETGVGVLGIEVPDYAVDEVLDDGGDVGFPLGQLFGAVVVEAAEDVSGGSPPRGLGHDVHAVVLAAPEADAVKAEGSDVQVGPQFAGSPDVAHRLIAKVK